MLSKIPRRAASAKIPRMMPAATLLQPSGCRTAAVQHVVYMSTARQTPKQLWEKLAPTGGGWAGKATRELFILLALAILTALAVSGHKVSKQVVPKDVYNLCRKAHEARQDGNIKKAVLLYKQALDRLESRRGDLFHLFEVTFRLGVCYEDIKDLRTASSYFDKACKLCTEMESIFEEERLHRQQTRVLHGVALSHLGEARHATGGKHKAIRDLTTATKLILTEFPDLEKEMKRVPSLGNHLQDDDVSKQFARVSLSGTLYNRACMHLDMNKDKAGKDDAEYSLRLITDALNWAQRKKKSAGGNSSKTGRYVEFATDLAKQLSEASGGVFSREPETTVKQLNKKTKPKYRVYEFSHVDELMSMRNHTLELIRSLSEE